MPRSQICRAAAAYGAPQAAQSPFQNLNQAQLNDWFKIENSADGSDTTHIYIYDSIGGWFGTNADEMLYQLKQVDTSRITLHINSPGGSVFEAVAIYNALRSHKAKVDVLVDGLAASAASFVAQAGDTVTMNQGAMMMVHDALAMTYGNKKDHDETGVVLDKISDNISEIYAARAGGTGPEWRETMKAEAWYTAKEAVDAGLADKVGDAKADDSATNKFDLSVFNFAGRENAPSPFAIMNQAKKEAHMADKKIETEAEKAARQVIEAAAARATGAVATEEVATEEAPTEDETTPVETDAEREAREATEAAAAESAANSQNSAVSFVMCNGQRVTDFKTIQAHIDGLEGFRKETQTSNRQDFVKQLAKDNKISASAIDSLTAYALTLGTEEAFAAWSATYEHVVPNPTFGKHTGGVTNSTGDATEKSELDKKLDTARAIVENMRNSQMAQDKLEKTPSYQFLKANNAL